MRSRKENAHRSLAVSLVVPIGVDQALISCGWGEMEAAGHLQEPGSFGWLVIRSTGFATGVADAGSGRIFRR
jgi:hypothetical protein